jgi:hypothetical protein
VGLFLAQLHEHGLVNSAPVTPGDPGAVTPVAAATTPYLAPVLNAYSDMKDLLLLDPIHDVAEEGWPIPKPVDS